MLKLAQVPDGDSPARPRAQGVSRIVGPKSVRRRRQKHRYYAFLSYSHKDQELADWLHRELEEFHGPRALAGKLTENGVIPKRLKPIFRDRHELAAADDLTEEIEAALASSQFLIVLCSPSAATSRWTNAEIEAFKRARPGGCVLAAIASGEPFASETPGHEAQECFPPALRHKFDRRGRPTGKRVEPLAADLREGQDGRRLGFLKLVAGMLGVGLDELVQRETMRRHRRMAWLAAASLGGMVVTSGLAFTAIQARDSARDQRREAEGLVAFMLGDLKDKLEPIGRLDALDGVGARVLAYYSKQDTSALSDEALLQRSRALSLTAEVANLRGDLDTAQRLYREAAAGTAEAVRRKPNDPQRYFDHAQNIYYFGDLAAQRGDFGRAEAAFQEYRRLADRMVAIEPNNLKWRMEVQYAEANLGIVLLNQRRFAEASEQFGGALRTIEAVAAIDPGNKEYRKAIPESLAWLADAELAQGNLASAIAHRERQVALLEDLSARSKGDVEYRQKLIPAQQKLGRMFAAHGDSAQADAHLRSAVTIAQALIPEEPRNSKWLEFGANAHLSLAQYLLAVGSVSEAAAETNSGCEIVQRLITMDRTVAYWQDDQQRCLTLRAQLALASGSAKEALGPARLRLSMAQALKGGDEIQNSFAVARSHQLLGDVYQRIGDRTAARAAWNAGLAAIPADARERPWETSVRADLLARLGDAATARQLAAKVAAMGFRTPDVFKA